MALSLSNRMLLGRLLTRSGDQAWDFAVPLVLLKILPGELRIAALYYLVVRFVLVVFLPKLTSLIDKIDRFNAAKLGIILQLIGVIIGLVSIFAFSFVNTTEPMLGRTPFILSFLFLIIGGILSSLGSSFMDISIANDLVPSSFQGDTLTKFNSHLRQVDLFTEVASPILAGLLLVVEWNSRALAGFFFVGIWNIISFFPEYLLLKSIFRERPDLHHKKIQIQASTTKPSFFQLFRGWRTFFREPVSLAVLAYAILWLSVLSPHGVLLTAYLKDAWKLPEWIIGSFRGAGALFGLASTILFPRGVRKWGLKQASLIFLGFQSLTLIAGYILFLQNEFWGQMGFLLLILFSRIGLYGFSLGEMQIRQEGIREEVRGEVNGFANALTGVATLGLFASGVILPSTEDFQILILSSVVFVVIAFLIFLFWIKTKARLELKNQSQLTGR